MGEMTAATTVSLVVLRGPVPAAKMLAALDVLTEGRLVAGLGPGSSQNDYDALGIPFEERWKRFDEAVAIVGGLVGGRRFPPTTRYYQPPQDGLTPRPRQSGGIPLWIGSWGSRGWSAPGRATGRRLACLGVQHHARAVRRRASAAGRRAPRAGQEPGRLPERAGDDVDLGHRESAGGESCPDPGSRSAVGPRPGRAAWAGLCGPCGALCRVAVALQRRPAAARVYLWPLGDEARQIELVAAERRPACPGLAHRHRTAGLTARAGRRATVADRLGLGPPTSGRDSTRRASQSGRRIGSASSRPARASTASGPITSTISGIANGKSWIVSIPRPATSAPASPARPAGEGACEFSSIPGRRTGSRECDSAQPAVTGASAAAMRAPATSASSLP